MLDLLRFALSLPLAVADAIWSRIERDTEEAFIAEQRQRFTDWAADQ